MCGIVGGKVQQIQQKTMEAMLACIAHRGPDGQGIWYEKEAGIFFGHTRLSVIDLSSLGDQPMARKKKGSTARVRVTYNGEIYNYKEMQAELEKAGYVFSSTSDTEVLLYAYMHWGISFVEKCIGMFAFALYDEETGALFLVRDRFGVKPLYYTMIDDDILFASDLRTFAAYPTYKKCIDREALSQYFQFGYIPGPRTIFQNTHKLPPGHILEIDTDGNRKMTQYWSAQAAFDKPHTEDSEREVLMKVEKLIEKSFSYRMVADVPVGIFLSSGVDSSLVAALLQKQRKEKIKTFTIGFDVGEYDESAAARKIAAALGTDHHELRLSPEKARKAMKQYVQTFSEPFGDTSGLPTYLLAEFARSHVTVALSGDGGDELFAGYTKYSALQTLSHMAEWKQRVLKRVIHSMGIPIVSRVVTFLGKLHIVPQYSNVREKLNKLQETLCLTDDAERFARASSYWQKEEVPLLFASDTQTTAKADALFVVTQTDLREQMQLWDVEQYLPDDILVKTDRTTMAVGLEGREPFLDAALWSYMATVSPEIKYKKLGDNTILKQLLRKYLPESLVGNQKKGFRIPLYEWLQSDWSEELERYFDKDMLAKQGIFNPEYINSLWRRFQDGNYVNPDKLWLFIAFQFWWESFVRADE